MKLSDSSDRAVEFQVRIIQVQTHEPNHEPLDARRKGPQEIQRCNTDMERIYTAAGSDGFPHLWIIRQRCIFVKLDVTWLKISVPVSKQITKQLRSLQ